MIKFLGLGLCFLLATAANATELKKAPAHFDVAKDFIGFVSINATKQLYVEYLAPAANRPTVVLLNGLTYTTRQWDDMTVFLKKAGLGVVRYDMSGMGKTLIKYGPQYSPYLFSDQVLELNKLLAVMQVPKPYNLVGLSYGGGIAAAYAIQFPADIKNVVLMAPYTAPIAAQDKWIKDQIAYTRMAFPYNRYSDDELYDYFLKEICYTTYPSAEPIVLEHPYKLEAVFRLTQGIRKFDLMSKLGSLPANSIHLVIAKKDQYIPLAVLEGFWAAIPVSARASLTYVENSEHKMPEAVPEKSASIVNFIVSK